MSHDRVITSESLIAHLRKLIDIPEGVVSLTINAELDSSPTMVFSGFIQSAEVPRLEPCRPATTDGGEDRKRRIPRRMITGQVTQELLALIARYVDLDLDLAESSELVLTIPGGRGIAVDVYELRREDSVVFLRPSAGGDDEV